MGHLTVQRAKNILEQHGTPVPAFVETGTHLGTTLYPIQASKLFERVYSIELSEALYTRACERLRSAPPIGSSLVLRLGDSARVLPALAREILEPAFFWLDAHWYESADVADGSPCPLFEELAAISLRKQADIVVIDDAQCFGRKWSDGPGGDWTQIHEEAIVGCFASERVARSGVFHDIGGTGSQLVIHLREP
jgi:hypothetical protein